MLKSEDTLVDARIRFLAKQLSTHFLNGAIPDTKACLCIGLECCDLTCPQWWNIFLRFGDGNEFRKLMRLKEYIIAEFVEQKENKP